MDALGLRFKKYIKFAESLREFCDNFHNYEYTETDYEDHKKELEENGYTIIPARDSVTGEICSYYGKV